MDRIIAAAKREARRRTKIDGEPLQRHLDAIAAEAGRRHWTDFLSSPVDVSENVLDRLVRETVEDGYSGMEIDIGDHVPEDLRPAVARAFRMDDGDLVVHHYRLGWDDVLHLVPSMRRRFKHPSNNANMDAVCAGRTTFLYNLHDILLAFETGRTGAWQKVHRSLLDESLANAPPVTSWWRGRIGRTLDEVVDDRALHARHVRKLAMILSSPDAPPVRHDPYSITEVPTCHPRLTRAHFAAVADLAIPDGPEASERRGRFVEASLAMKDQKVACSRGWHHRNAGLTEMTEYMAPGRILTSLLTKPDGPLARAVDGDGEYIRKVTRELDRSEDIYRQFRAIRPDLLSSERYEETKKATDLDDDAWAAWIDDLPALIEGIPR